MTVAPSFCLCAHQMKIPPRELLADHLWGCLDCGSKKEKREKDKHDPQSSLRFCPRFNALALYTRIMFVQWESGEALRGAEKLSAGDSALLHSASL